MPPETSQAEQDRTNLLGLRGVPAYFYPCPISWPWEMEIIDLDLLSHNLKVARTPVLKVAALLMDLSGLILRDRLPHDADLIQLVGRIGRPVSAPLRGVIKGLAALAPKDRLRCCVHIKTDVRIVGGRALLLDPDHEGELLFGDDPVNRIHNGLWALNPGVLSEPRSSTSSLWFLPCPAFVLSPCILPHGPRIDSLTIPALYIGLHSVYRTIHCWQAGFWLNDISRGYAICGKDLQERWLQQVPGARKPDPVYRFLLKPSERLRQECLVFLRQANDKLRDRLANRDKQADKATKTAQKRQPLVVAATDPSGDKAASAGGKRGGWAHDGPPEEPGWFGPCEGPLYTLEVLLGYGRDTIMVRNSRGTIWVMRVHSKMFRVWFTTKVEYENAKAISERQEKITKHKRKRRNKAG